MITTPAAHTSESCGANARVVVVDRLEGLEALAPEWQDLADSSIEPNVFYEPWMLRNAVRWLVRASAIKFVFIYLSQEHGSGQELLAGFVPVSVCVHLHGLPLKTISLLKHKYCFLSVPLLRQGHAEEALGAFFSWMEGRPFGCSILEMDQILGTGPFAEVLRHALWKHCGYHLTTKWHPRAFMRRAASGEEYLSRAVSKSHRKDLARKERRLAECGKVEYRTLERAEDAGKWIDDFLSLEASGWKGKACTAFMMSPVDKRFFRDAMIEASKLGKLMMLGLFVDSKPVALKCNLVSGAGSYAFKIAFDESYSQYSPGLLLEHENIRAVHASPAIEWMDSCAVPDHPMFLRLWTEHRIMQTVVVSAGSKIADLAVAAVPLLRSIRRILISRTAADQDPGGGETRRNPERMAEASICQIEKQQQIGHLHRPGFLAAPYSIWRRFWSYRSRKGLFAALWKSILVMAQGIRSLFHVDPRYEPAPKLTGEVLNLDPGEWVEVKRLDEIQATLDGCGMHHGLLFTGEMSDFCGRRFRVHKRVELLYNEYTKQQRRLKNTVLLEGAHCKGTGFGCDRSCFHFWREAWLRRVAAGDVEAAEDFQAETRQ